MRNWNDPRDEAYIDEAGNVHIPETAYADYEYAEGVQS